MKKNHKIINRISLLLGLLIILLINFPIKLLAQDIKFNDSPIATNVNRYWHYRDRLKYFTIRGKYESGEGLIAGIRNQFNGSILDFSEEAVYMGYYLGVLATEYKLLSDNNANYNQTLTDLYYTLNAYIYQMDRSETGCHYEYPSKFDGFFIRSNIDESFLSDNTVNQHINEGLSSANTYNSGLGNFGAGLSPGQPGYINWATPNRGCEPMSQDEAIGLLTGLALVAHLVPSGPLTVYDNYGLPFSYAINDTAKLIAQKIVQYIGHNPYWYYEDDWHIYTPDGVELDNGQGGDATWMAWGFSHAGAKITGLPLSDFNPQGSGLWTLPVGRSKASNAWMMCSLSAMSDTWSSGDIRDVANSNDKDWATFYVLLWAVMHDNYSDDNVQDLLSDALNQLNGAPCDGPYCYGADHLAANGWCTSYRWHCNSDEQTSGEDNYFYGNYNGLDYMLLLNLYCIVTGNSWEYNTRPVYGDDFPVYMPILGVIGDASYPVFVAAEDNIVSNAKFHNSVSEPWGTVAIPAVGTYKAKNNIFLEPGFAVEHGAYFHGLIQDVSCYDIWMSWKHIDTNNDSITDNENDSINLKSLQKDKDSLKLFPNPNNGKMNVAYNLIKGENGIFKICDPLGDELYSYPLYEGKNTFTINETNLNSGIYFYRATANNKIFAKDKIVVIK